MMTATILNPGDIAIVGYITNGTPDSFSFVSLVPLNEGTVIYFTDNGWMGSEFRDTEGTIKFTVKNDIAAGTVINSNDISDDFTWEGSFNLNVTNDQIAAVQSNNLDNPLSSDFTPIYQIDYTGSFEDADSANTSSVITGLSEADNTAVLFDNTARYAAFNLATLNTGTREDWLAAINNSENWTFNNNQTNLPSGTIKMSILVTNINNTGEGSLREAIILANSSPGIDTITFDASLSGQTIVLDSELLITDDLNIQGLGANQLTISGNNESRVFKIDDGSNDTINVTIEDLTITGGKTNANAGDESDDGAGIWNRENLTLKNVVVRGNESDDDGGGIRNDGEITIIGSTIADNKSIGGSETSGGGGLINTIGASAIVINSTFSGNEAKNGGAIRNDDNLTLINSTLSGNTASESGGGLVNTVNPNNPINPASGGKATISNSTITNNTAQDTSGEGAIFGGAGSGIANFGIATVSNSIIAKNKDNDDFTNLVLGQSNSNGNNLIGNGEGVDSFINGENGDIVGTADAPVNPLLGSLQGNGGATKTHALLPESPAINAGSNSNLVADNSDLNGNGDTSEQIPFDSTGKPRVLDQLVDIGAFEYDANNIAINQIDGTPEDDRLNGRGKDDSIDGMGGNDTLSGKAGNDTLMGGSGDDRLSGNKGDDFIDGGMGIDTLREIGDVNFKLTDVQLWGNGIDTLVSIEKAFLTGGDSANTIDASEFDGTANLNGGAGDDTLLGGIRNNTIRGGADNDLIDGGGGKDKLYGEAGDDTLVGGRGRGDDLLDGGEGFDTIKDTTKANFTLTDTQLMGNGTDTLVSIEEAILNGTSSANQIDASGFSGVAKLNGRGGNDTLIGGMGRDVLKGGLGNDFLDSGAGNDRMYGGDGSDTFVIAFVQGKDTIFDFEDGVDSLGLSGGLSFGQLDIVDDGDNTNIIRGNRTLATLLGVDSTLIDVNDFTDLNSVT